MGIGCNILATRKEIEDTGFISVGAGRDHVEWSGIFNNGTERVGRI
jgi:hypothetical protein